MIVEGLLQVCVDLIFVLFQGIEVISLPFEIVGVLSTLLQYGVWVVGADVLGLVFACVFGWWSIKMTIGLAIFIWDLLPLT